MLIDLLQSFAIICIALAQIIHVRRTRIRFTKDDLLSGEKVHRWFNSNAFDRGK